MPTFVAFLETDLLVASKPERPRSPGRAGRKPGYWPCGAHGDSAAMGNRRPYRDKTRKHRFLWATRPVFFESMFSSARRPGNFQVDVDPVDNFGSSSNGVRARRPGNFQVDVDPVDNFGSSSNGVRARRPGNFQVDVDPVDNFG